MSIATTQTARQADAMSAQELELAHLIVTTLKLDMDATEVCPTAPLYGDGLGLDSIDVLELALAISKTYGVKLRSDNKDNATIFGSLRSLCQHIQVHRIG
jgi:acyl carrier protein